jgi:hypothetical protein
MASNLTKLEADSNWALDLEVELWQSCLVLTNAEAARQCEFIACSILQRIQLTPNPQRDQLKQLLAGSTYTINFKLTKTTYGPNSSAGRSG